MDTVPWQGPGDGLKARREWHAIWLVLNGFLGNVQSICCSGKLITKGSPMIDSLYLGHPAVSLPPTRLCVSFSLIL